MKTAELNFEPLGSIEPQEPYALTVKVTDGGGLSATTKITVSVGDVNEAPFLETMTGAKHALSVAENSPRNTEVTSAIKSSWHLIQMAVSDIVGN